jgi:hypothetical protein
MTGQSDTSATLLRLLRQRGALPSAELQRALGVSRATLSRAVARCRGEVLRFGQARATMYATPRHIAGQSTWPLYRITDTAGVEVLGEVVAVGRAEFALRSRRPLPAFMPPPFAAGVFPDLPWFLDDQRPQGFLGRHFAHRLAAVLGTPDDLKLWTGDHVVAALIQHGEEQLGDLVLGERCLERALAAIEQPIGALTLAERERVYPVLARAALQGEPIGSSPGGEQQKFTATLSLPERCESLIVKFVEVDANPVAMRWASLLRCEALAATTLREHGIGAAADRVLEAAGQLFLESPRFDRTARLGRRGLVSLAALDAAFYGHARIAWWQFAISLRDDGWISADDADSLQRIHWFGSLIGNTDMHLGNTSLILTDACPLALAPVYDMLPMLWQPSPQGTLVPRTLTVPIPAPGQLQHWRWAAKAALQFWAEVAAEPLIDDELKRAAEAAWQAIRRALERFGPR